MAVVEAVAQVMVRAAVAKAQEAAAMALEDAVAEEVAGTVVETQGAGAWAEGMVAVVMEAA
jgi:hypothetical protein